MKLIAETAWHHEGNFEFMWQLIDEIVDKSQADIVKMHLTLDFDEYMCKDHELYELLKTWMLSEAQWEQLIELVKNSGKQLMLLLNDTKAIEFGMQFNPELVEIHSVCLNNPFLLNTLNSNLENNTKVVFGVGGCDIVEVDYAVSQFNNTVLMFGFQNFPTQYEHINLAKIRKLMRLFQGCQFGYADHTAWDEPNNELITLLGAANGMDYIEKHVTTHYGKKRTDYAAAISVDMFNQLAEKLKILEGVEGSGRLALNEGEKAYSTYGPLKMAVLSQRNLPIDTVLSLEDIQFQRTGQISDLSQLDVLDMLGKKICKDIDAGKVLMKHHFQADKGVCK